MQSIYENSTVKMLKIVVLMSENAVITFVFIKYLFNFSAIKSRLCVAAVTFGHLKIIVNSDVKFPIMDS